MCRGKNNCSELDANPDIWDKECLLRPPTWLDSQIVLFAQAVSDLARGNKDDCLKVLEKIRSEEIGYWFAEHGQMSGRHRRIKLNLSVPQKIEKSLRDPIRSPKKLQNAVFERDNYHCRYCGNKLVSQNLLTLFTKKINSPAFQRGPTNQDAHGIIHAAWPVADHVHPWNLGGKTNMDNLVSSCAGCNYGKDGYTCEQVGIRNPLDRPPINDSWDGLVSFETDIKRIA